MNLVNSILGGVILILLACAASLWKDNSSLTTELELATTAKTTAVINHTICSVVRNSQSSQIKAWMDKANEVKAAANLALAAAEVQAKNQEMLIEDIRNAEPTDNCEAIRVRMIEDAFR